MNLTAENINEILGVSESFELPEKVMGILLDEEKRVEIFDKFLAIESDLSFDWFTNYFQEGSSNRKKMMQDFTPKELTQLCADLLGDFTSCLDVCAGTGGLTIAAWREHRQATFYAEELSRQAFPLLLLNMAIRNINGIAVNRNTLTGELLAAYRLEAGEKYSAITPCDFKEFPKVDICVTNPPYSLKWTPPKQDARFEEYGYAPSGRADYAFVLHGFYHLKENGRLCAILPQGVLFRSGAEEKIRANLIKAHRLDSVIGLPKNLFLNTAIPVCFMLLNKEASDKPVLFIDASEEAIARSKQSRLSYENMAKILSVYKSRECIKKFSDIADMAKLEEEDYNLQISVYVDTYEPPPTSDNIVETMREFIKQDREIKRRTKEIHNSLAQIIALLGENAPEILELQTELQGTKVGQKRTICNEQSLF